MQPFTIDVLGRWSYAFCVALYGLLLIRLMWYFRCTFRFTVRRVAVTMAVYALLLLGFAFEWMADIFFVWDFPEGRHLFKLPVPVFGWVTGHRVPIEELLWIGTVVPLFYFLYLYSTLLFHDIIYVVDEDGRFYKREERWVGLTRATKIAQRRKGERGQEHEVLVQRRPPGFIARYLARHFNEPPPHRVVQGREPADPRALRLRDDGHDVPGVDALVSPIPRGDRDQGSLAGAIQRGVTGPTRGVS